MIILNARGQTGNKFFTYLTYLGDSLESGEKIVILSPDMTTRYFPNLKSSKIIKFPFYFESIANYIGYRFYIKMLYFFWGNKYSLKLLSFFFKFIPRVNFVIAPTGSNKSKNHLKHTLELKNLFTPHYEIISDVNLVFKIIRIKHQIICGVHIRRKDYKTWNNGKYFYTDKQYHSAMLNVKKIFPNNSIAFFISSDEKIDCSYFSNCNCFSIPKSNAVKDLYGLSISDYIIGPPSTFSGWASYFGDIPLYFIENPDKEITLSLFKKGLEIWE